MGHAAYSRGSKAIRNQIDREQAELKRAASIRRNRGEVIGRLRNNWRQRDVTVYASADPGFVDTIGVPFDGGAPIETHERIEDWKSVISVFPRTAVYN
jgi:hypothetical protein